MDWSGSEAKNSLELLSWKVDVEWCGIIFSEGSQQVATGSSSSADMDWEALASSLGLINKLPSDTSQLAFGPVKVTGVVLLLGLGSYLCYKLYKVWLSQQFQRGFNGRSSGSDNCPPPPSSSSDDTPAFSYHHLSNSSASFNDFLNVKTHYFGPVHGNNDDNCFENETIQCQDFPNLAEMWSPPSSGVEWRVTNRKRKCRISSPPSHTHRGWLMHRIQTLTHSSATQVLNGEEDRWSNKQSPRREGNSTGTSSTGSSPMSHPRGTGHSLSLSRDLSMDSLGLFRTQREGSIDSMSSELSFDMPSFTEQNTENVTVARLDKLQEEIDQLKSNCQLMDEEFETVKCNRNLPGLSDLMEAAEHQGQLTDQDIIKRQSAKACFKGLYSLTTINRSMSMELSLDEDSPQNSQVGLSHLTEEEHLPSLEWDEEYGPGPDSDMDQPNVWTSLPPPASPSPSSKLDTSGYGSKLDLSGSLTGSQFSCFGSPSSPGEELRDAINTEILRSMSCESQAETTWSLSQNDSDLDSPTVDNGTPTTDLLNIGPRVDILTYAQQEWTGNTPKAKTILRGYKEIKESLQCPYLRRIRGDNYCALRSAIFQTLAQGLSVPSGVKALARLSVAHNVGSHWRFNNLPYSGTNVLRGMEICLQALDNISALLRSSERSVSEREETLYNLLNTDPTLDLHIMEAVKLHMMVSTLDLHQANSDGQDVPLFSILMFARDTSERPIDFMNNHLFKVGDTGGLEQVEMYLLGFTLGVTLKVVRPSAHGTKQFVCYYPDDNVDTWPQVTLLAEDDRHYNVLCT